MTRWLSLAIACGSMVGCTVTASEARLEGLADEGVASLAVVRVERTGHGAEPMATGSTVVEALFARYRGLSADGTLELLGTSARAEVLTGCRWDATHPPETLAYDAAVELLDVGPILVELDARAVVLQGRLFPGVHNVLGGTTYAEEISLPTHVDVGEEYRLSAPGLGGVGQLDAAVPVPAAPSGLRVNGAPLHTGLAIHRGRHLTVAWDPGDAGDRVEVELRAGGRLVRCGARDEGRFQLRVEALAHIPADEAAQLTVSRVRREPLDVSGVELAWARLVSRRVVSVAVR